MRSLLTVEAGQLEQAYAQWEDAQLLLGSLLLHDEIDQAERLFQRVLTAEYIESTTDYRIDCSELLTPAAPPARSAAAQPEKPVLNTKKLLQFC